MIKNETIGSLIDELYAQKQKIAAINQELKRETEVADQIEAKIMERLAEQDMTQGRGTAAVASVNEQSHPKVENWDEFYKFIHENRYYHLLQRRPSSPACNELFANDGRIPGVVKFTKKVVNLRGI